MDYLDTSLLIGLLTREERSRQLDIWFQRLPPKPVAISAWVIAEFSSALAFKIRLGILDPVERAFTLARFHRLRQNYRMLPIEMTHFMDAARMVDRARNLRAQDALHLAVASSAGATVWTLDEGLVKAASELSLLAAIPDL